jgi:hypothetical protein
MNTSRINNICKQIGGLPINRDPTSEQLDEDISDITYDNILAASTDETEEFDFGTKVLTRGKSIKKFNLKENEFINLSDPSDKNKILQLNTLDEFDEFTDRYGNIDELNNEQIIYIDWKKVRNDYKGLYVNHGLYDDRYETAYYKANVYTSWWKLEYHADDTLLFTEEPEPIAQGNEITKPFEGTVHDKLDFDNNQFTSDFNKKNPEKLFLINSFDTFDEITSKYGQIYQTKSGKQYLRLDWNDFASDYKGFMVDSESEIDERLRRAYYMDKKYISWVLAEKINTDKVYIFM